MLVCDSLSVKFGDKEVLKNISFTLKNGQNLLILGENGAGKSTLAKALCALLPSNAVSISNKELSTIPPKELARAINYVSPKLESYDEYISLVDYLLMGYFDSKKKFEPYSAEEKGHAEQMLCRFELGMLADKKLCTLSSGEKQMAMILQAALQNSRITIFDEPIANIDTSRAQTLFELLKGNEVFCQKIVITHDLQFAYSLGFDILYIQDGKVDFFGSSEEFFDKSALAKRFDTSVQKCEYGVVANYAKI